MQILNRVLNGFQRPVAILAGAGISMDSPAGLPNARSMMERALLHRISKAVAPEELTHVIDRPTDFPSRPGEFLRFEVAMADVTPDFRATILSELQSGTPNANHYALAELVKQGFIVITTNFDLHIETAYKHLYGHDCQVPHRDDDFATIISPEFDSRGWLWKIHGSLTDVNSIAATFTTIFSKRSLRMIWLEKVLENYDLIVVGYSGSDDLDLIPPLARTITDRSLLWVDHKGSGEPQWITPQQWLARGSALMHLDCAGLTRVMFSCHSVERATRRDGAAMILAGPTRTVLEDVLAWAGVKPTMPATPPSIVPKVQFAAVRELNEFESACHAIGLLEFSRGPKVEAMLERANRQMVTYGINEPASSQLQLLIRLYNSETVRHILGQVGGNRSEVWAGIAKNDNEAFMAKMKEIAPLLSEQDMPAGFRLLGCLHYERNKYQAQKYFERSIMWARDIGDLFAEMSTLSTYSNILYPSHFPVFWLDERPFPHADRMEELVNATGYVPMVGQGNLVRGRDYAVKLQVFSPDFVQEHAAVGFFDVFGEATEARRMAIDMGDVRGEMDATFVIAELTLVSAMYYKHVPMFNAWTECQRLSLLAEALGDPPKFGERLSYVMRMPKPETEASREELKRSMFPPL